MAIILIDGFDTYNGIGRDSAGWTLLPYTLAGTWYAPGYPNFSLVAGRFGGQALSIPSQNAVSETCWRYLPEPITQGTLGFALRMTAMPTSATYSHFGLVDNGQAGLAFRINNNGSITFGRTSNQNSVGTVLGTTATGLIVLNTWHYIEIEFTIANTGGVINIYVDNTLVSSGSSYDTLQTSSTINKVFLGPDLGEQMGTHQVDDLYMLDTTTRLGEQRVETIYPIADTAQKQWTGQNRGWNMGTNDSISTSFYATKGNIFTANGNVSLSSVTLLLGDVTQYLKLGIAQLSSVNPGTVTSVLYETDIIISRAPGDPYYYTFAFPNVSLINGRVYAIYVTRTDGTGTAALTIALPTVLPSTSDPNGMLTYGGVIRVADNNITPGDSLYHNNTWHVPMFLEYQGLPTVDNYTLIDEAQMTFIDGIYSNTVGNFDLYEFGNLSSTPAKINAVQVSAFASKDQAGTRAIASVVKSGSSTADSANIYLSGTDEVYNVIYENNPVTSLQWTANDVNSVQNGIKVTV